MAEISKINFNGTTYNLAINYVNLIPPVQTINNLYEGTVTVNNHVVNFVYLDQPYSGSEYENAITFSVDNARCYFAILDNNDQLHGESLSTIYDYEILSDINILSNYKIEILIGFTGDYPDDIENNLQYQDINYMRSILTPLCEFSINKDKTGWNIATL